MPTSLLARPLASPRYLKRAKIHLKIIVVGTCDAPREASLYVVGLATQRATLLARLPLPYSSGSNRSSRDLALIQPRTTTVPLIVSPDSI